VTSNGSGQLEPTLWIFRDASLVRPVSQLAGPAESPDKVLARGVFVSYWFRNDNRLPQARLAVASYIIVE